MLIHSKKLGAVEIDESEIVILREGILGFEHLYRYVILKRNSDSPFRFLQAVDDPDIAFPIMDPYRVRFDYEFCLARNDVRQLGLKAGEDEDIEVYCIVTVPEEVASATINLRAPVLINRRTRLGKQVILRNSLYNVRHNILAELQRSMYLLKHQKQAAGG